MPWKILANFISSDPVFCLLSLLILGCALLVVLQNNLVRAGFALMGCFGAMSLLLFSLKAYFVAVSQLMIYTVGISLLVIFAIMLLRGTEDQSAEEQKASGITEAMQEIFALLTCLTFFVLFAFSVMGLPNLQQSKLALWESKVSMVRQFLGFDWGVVPGMLNVLGKIMLSEQLLAFELISVLLLIVFVNAIYLTKRDKSEALSSKND